MRCFVSVDGIPAEVSRFVGEVECVRQRPLLRCSLVTKYTVYQGRQPSARGPHLARQTISMEKLQVLHTNFVMIRREDILTLTCINIRTLLAQITSLHLFFSVIDQLFV